MIRSGLVSITFRKLEPAEIARLAAMAGLEGIEWGGDVHVPHGDLANARTVRRITEESGLTVTSYGSYYCVGESEEQGLAFEKVLDTASELGAPLIRVWAGKRPSESADAAYRSKVVRESRRIADLAAAAGLTIAYEFHGNSLTDTNASAVHLLEEVAHDRVTSYWQPVGRSLDYCIRGIQAILPWLSNIHVFHWSGTPIERRPLEEGYEIWKGYLEKVLESERNHWAMLEFVRDDSPEMFLRDAAVLKKLLREINPSRHPLP